MSRACPLPPSGDRSWAATADGAYDQFGEANADRPRPVKKPRASRKRADKETGRSAVTSLQRLGSIISAQP